MEQSVVIGILTLVILVIAGIAVVTQHLRSSVQNVVGTTLPNHSTRIAVLEAKINKL